MEEQKCKIVEMNSNTESVENTKETEKPQKMSYEQLEQVAHQLSEQARQLYDQLQKANLNNMFKRLDYLFKVIESKEAFSHTFYEKCIKEIEEIMTVPEEDKETEDKDK